jgi:hypothetical protein
MAELMSEFFPDNGNEVAVMRENLPVERLVPEARSAEEPNGRPGFPATRPFLRRITKSPFNPLRLKNCR